MYLNSNLQFDQPLNLFSDPVTDKQPLWFLVDKDACLCLVSFHLLGSENLRGSNADTFHMGDRSRSIYEAGWDEALGDVRQLQLNKKKSLSGSNELDESPLPSEASFLRQQTRNAFVSHWLSLIDKFPSLLGLKVKQLVLEITRLLTLLFAQFYSIC